MEKILLLVLCLGIAIFARDSIEPKDADIPVYRDLKESAVVGTLHRGEASRIIQFDENHVLIKVGKDSTLGWVRKNSIQFAVPPLKEEDYDPDFMDTMHFECN